MPGGTSSMTLSLAWDSGRAVCVRWPIMGAGAGMGDGKRTGVFWDMIEGRVPLAPRGES